MENRLSLEEITPLKCKLICNSGNKPKLIISRYRFESERNGEITPGNYFRLCVQLFTLGTDIMAIIIEQRPDSPY
jgi:hypothetical protein